MLQIRFTIPGQIPRTVPLDQSRMMIGTLLSNHIALRAPGVDPIHAMIENTGEGNTFNWVVTDLGSATGVKLNGMTVDVEAQLKTGDRISIGSVVLEVMDLVIAPPPVLPQPGQMPPRVPPPQPVAMQPIGTPAPANVSQKPTQPAANPIQGKADNGPAGRISPVVLSASVPQAAQPAQPAQAATVRQEPAQRGGASSDRRTPTRPKLPQDIDAEPKDILFSPRDARPSGDFLEVVAYWGDTVLEVDLFHPKLPGFEAVTIGDPTKAHLIAAGPDNFSRHVLATVSESGYKLRLLPGMQARLRRAGKVEKVEGEKSISLDRRDIAHIKYGAVRYFMLFVRPPVLELPRSGPKDPLFATLLSFGFLFYFFAVGGLLMMKPPEKKDDKADIWSVVQIPEKIEPPKPEKKPPPEKPKVEIVEKKVPPPPKPPPPKPPPIKPVKPVEKEKITQPKPVEKPVPEKRPTEALTQTKNTVPAPVPQKPTETEKPKDLSKLDKATQGMPSTGAKSPDFKMAGPASKTPLGASGGPKGAGNNQKGGEIKGNKAASVKGVEGVNNEKPSGVNLDKLGLGVGKVLSKTGAGAISTPFKDSAGGAGGGMGSGSKTYGFGGVGGGKSLGIPGSGTSANNFGSGSGGLLGGQGGSGGLGGNGTGPGFGSGGSGAGHGRANVEVPPGDPVVSGGLTPQEIQAVIRANLNQIRHCYEQLLQRSPSASGKIGVNFTVGGSGGVDSVRVTDSTVSDSRMQGCVTGSIQRWKFPQPRGGQPVTVNYPFVFNPL